MRAATEVEPRKILHSNIFNNLSRCQPEKMNFLALQVTEIFDRNGKPQKG